jgi:outer membrane lipoprotein-sorting protein
MKIFKVIILAISATLLMGSNSYSQELTAKDIIVKADEKNRGESMRGTMSMTIVRPKWERTIVMKNWSKGNENFMIYITEPAKEKGQVFLKAGKEMWNYVPTISRMIKIPPSMMMQSWMGSDFTNDDLVKQSSIVVDYTHTLISEEVLREHNCYVIELIPLPEAPVVWGKIKMWITKDGFDLWKSEYYDEDGYLINIENAYNLKQMGDRIIPTKIEMIPVDEEGKKTVLEFIEMEFNIEINDSFFSKQNMKKVR